MNQLVNGQVGDLAATAGLFRSSAMNANWHRETATTA